MKNFLNYICQDWKVNQDTSFKSRLALLLFRLTNFSEKSPKITTIFIRIVYQIIVEYALGIEIPWDTKIGANLKLQHGHALVINHGTIIGENCILRHCTTIGNKKLSDGSYSDCPIIGNNVDIGANVVILGAVTVGDNAVIGAASVVVKDVPSGAVVVGNPARVIRTGIQALSSICESELATSELLSISSNSPVETAAN